MADGEVFQKTVDDKVVILNVRSPVLQGILAPNWLDLRVGFFVSLTDATNDDLITGLAETIAGSPGLSQSDLYYIGLKDSSRVFPGLTGTTFIGFTNSGIVPGLYDSKLVSSDIGVGTTNTNFWRPENSNHYYDTFAMYQGRIRRAHGGTFANALAPHFPQNVAGAGGYSVLLGFRLLRDRVNSNAVTVQVKSNLHSADMLYSSVPENDLLRSSLAATWPTSQSFGPVEFSEIPLNLFAYWPFGSSRLRIHCMGILKAE